MSWLIYKSGPVNPSMFMVLIFFVLCISSAFGESGNPAEDNLRIKVRLLYSGLDALPWHSKVHVYLDDVSPTSASNPKVVTEKTFLTNGEQIPIRTSLSISGGKLLSNHRYAICADISILGRLSFVCDKEFIFSNRNRPRIVNVRLRRLP